MPDSVTRPNAALEDRYAIESLKCVPPDGGVQR